jgi:hypothetical protein
MFVRPILAAVAASVRSALPVVLFVVAVAAFFLYGMCGCAGDLPELAEAAAEDGITVADTAPDASSPPDAAPDASSPPDAAPDALSPPDASSPPDTASDAPVRADTAGDDTSGCTSFCLGAGRKPTGEPCAFNGECCSLYCKEECIPPTDPCPGCWKECP